jgi:hypothetical protein
MGTAQRGLESHDYGNSCTEETDTCGDLCDEPVCENLTCSVEEWPVSIASGISANKCKAEKVVFTDRGGLRKRYASPARFRRDLRTAI